MKKSLIFSILIFVYLLSCSKSNNEAATQSTSDETSSIVAADSTVIAADSAFSVTSGPPQPSSLNGAHEINARDSVQEAFNSIKPTLHNPDMEIITPNLSNLPDKTVVSSNSPGKESIIENPKNAVLGFSYFPQIPLNEERDLRVFVKIQGEAKQVANKLKAIEKEDLEFTKTNDSSIVCIVKDIKAFRKLSIKPFYDYDDFRITKVDDGMESVNNNDPNEQLLDFVNGNYWHWKVKAVAKSSHVGTVTLIIKAETPAGQKIQLAERQVRIKIGIDQPPLRFSQKVYAFFDSHFKEVLSLIIIPLALYLFNFLRKNFILRQENNPKTPDNK